MTRAAALKGILLSVGTLFHVCYSDVKCRNDDGVEVDWFILYKLPNEIEDGLSYLYMDERTNGWKVSRKNINSRDGSLGNTLKPLLDFYDRKTQDFGYILYNDQPPDSSKSDRVSSSYGHSKGVVMLDRRTGLWLSHSTPKFPNYPSKDFWPKSGNVNGQTFLCVTFPYKQFKLVGEQLKYIHPYTFDYYVPETFPMELQRVAQRRYPTTAPWVSVTTLTSERGRNFSSFAKYSRFKDDLYSGLIVDHVSQDLFVKSWGKLSNPLPSNCTPSRPHHVFNVKKVKVTKKTAFSDTQDHSKWCVTSDDSLTCIADMNREQSQMSRAGGAICTDGAAVGRAFKALISDHEPCKKSHSHFTREL